MSLYLQYKKKKIFFVICGFSLTLRLSLIQNILFIAGIDDPWQLEEKIDDVEIIGSLGRIIAVMGAFALAERRMNYRELKRGEMYFRKVDMNNS